MHQHRLYRERSKKECETKIIKEISKELRIYEYTIYNFENYKFNNDKEK